MGLEESEGGGAFEGGAEVGPLGGGGGEQGGVAMETAGCLGEARGGEIVAMITGLR